MRIPDRPEIESPLSDALKLGDTRLRSLGIRGFPTLVERGPDARCGGYAIRYQHRQNHLQNPGSIDCALDEGVSVIDGD